MSANLFNQAIGLISSLLVVKFLRPAELAEARIITTYSGYVNLLGSLGLATSVLTFVPRSNDPATRRRWLKSSLRIVGAATLGLSVVAAILASLGWLMSDIRSAYWFRWALLGAVASSASSVLIAFYQAERAVRKLAGMQTVLRVAALVVVVGGTWLWGFGGYVIAGAASSVWMLTGLVCVMDRRPAGTSRAPLPPGFLKAAVLALLAMILWTAGRTADVIILDRFVTDRAQFGCYSLALSIGVIVSMVMSTAQVVAVPYFAARHQDAAWILANARKWQLVGLALGVLTAAAAYGGTVVLVWCVYGPAYAAASSFLIPILAAQCLLATFHVQAAALAGVNLVRVNTMVAALVVPFSVLLTLAMVWRFGIWGAAWAQVIAAAIYAGVQASWGWAQLARGVRPSEAGAGDVM